MDKISINILNYNTYLKSKSCIESVMNQDYPNIEILLIDNNSTDDSLEKLKIDFADSIQYLENKENYGYAKGNNLGVSYCADKGIKYCFLLNSDITLEGNHLISKLYETICEYPNCAIVAPYIYNTASDSLVLNNNDSGYLKMLRRVGILPKNYNISQHVSTISEAQGSALFVRVNNFMKVKGFPEHYFMYGEESTFAKKILWDKHNILWFEDENNYVVHHHDKSKKVDNWRVYLMGRNRTLEFLENRHEYPLRWRLVFLAFILNYLKSGKYPQIYMQGVKAAFSLSKNANYFEACYENGYKAMNCFWG